MSTKVPLPAGTTLGKSFEYGIDCNLGTYEVPVWQAFRRISGFQPAPTPTEQDAQTYDDLGAQNTDVTGWSFQHQFNVLVNRSLITGLYLPEIEALLARTRPSATGELAVLDVRWYHKPAVGTPNPTDAGRGFVTVSVSRQNTGPNGEIERLAVTLKGKGPAEEIPNPFTGWNDEAPPTVMSVQPAGRGAGGLVTIYGASLLGATAVTFGDEPAAAFEPVSSTTIVASLPEDAAGVVDVEVTTPHGTSPAKPYTRTA